MGKFLTPLKLNVYFPGDTYERGVWSSLIIRLAFIIIIIIIKTLFTLWLERKIYKNEIITAKDKRVIHASRSRTSHLQARLRETSNPKNANTLNRKRRKLTYLLLWI